jgi:hypothetical protein
VRDKKVRAVEIQDGVTWAEVVDDLVKGCTLFGCLAIEPTGTIVLVSFAGIGVFLYTTMGGDK